MRTIRICVKRKPVMHEKSQLAVSRGSALQSPLPPRVTSTELLRGQNTVEIEHGGQRYFLRLTRENKLILTK